MTKTTLGAAAVAAALVGAGIAGAHGLTRRVSLTIVGTHGRSSSSCAGNSDSFANVVKGSTVRFKGQATPKPKAGWRMKVEVFQCVGGKYKKTWTQTAGGAVDGTYNVPYPAKTAGLFKVKSIYGKNPQVNSGNRHFRVR
jgi:hypothetical protein